VPALRLSDAARAVGGRAPAGADDVELTGVSTDTRAIVPGSLFVALEGERFDAHDFLADAARGGARAALVGRSLPAAKRGGLPLVKVDDTRRALGELARFHASRLPAARVAVTGSNGKTTTKELLRAALAAAGPTVASERSFNNDVGVPLTLLSIVDDTRFAVLEMGTNHPGEIARLADLGRPRLGIVTNCAAAHVEFLKDLDGVIEEKGALVAALPEDGVAILNADDPACARLRARARCRVVTFGVRRPADFRAVDIRFDLRRLTYHLRATRVYVPLGGCHNVYNSLAALAAADALGVPLGAAIAALRTAAPPPGRLAPQRIGGGVGAAAGAITLVDDSYNANPGSVEAAFRTLAAAPAKGRRVVVLGDMLELGPRSAELHRRCGELVSLMPELLLVAAGRFAADVASGATAKGLPPERLRICADGAAAAELLPPLLEPGDTVLVKGSRGMAMEQVVAAIRRRFEPAPRASAGRREPAHVARVPAHVVRVMGAGHAVG
jgi:UDP-N-acetylmuramoyl-tripeptide--D-alanyl-D-alanine ligase